MDDFPGEIGQKEQEENCIPDLNNLIKDKCS